jgi:hypothetical protein
MMDGLAFFFLGIFGARIISDLIYGKPIGEYLAGIAIGWAIIHVYYLYLRQKKEDYPENWSEIRNNILRRDNYACCNCRYTKKLHVHHIVPLSRGGTNNETNLITLCERCHIMIHPHMR